MDQGPDKLNQDQRQPDEQQQQQQQQHEVEELRKLLADMLLEADYSIEKLIKLAQERSLNLNQVREHLLKHLQNLNQTSVELFDESYDRFFKLSHIIACLAEPIHQVVNPIQTYRNRIGDICHSHDNYIQEIDRKLFQLEETTKNKQLANLMIELIKRRDRIFRQIQRIDLRPSKQLDDEGSTNKPTGPGQLSIEDKIRYDTIERVHMELYYLSCEVSAIQPTNDELIPIRESLQSSIRDAMKTIRGSDGTL